MSWKSSLIQSWIAAGTNLLSNSMTVSKLERIAWDFFYANEQKQFIGVRHFLRHLSAAVEGKQTETTISESFLSLLISGFNLGVEGDTHVLSRCVLFDG